MKNLKNLREKKAISQQKLATSIGVSRSTVAMWEIDASEPVNGVAATFKRVEKKQNGIMLKPLNPEYETTFFSNAEIEALPVRVLGVARELRRKTLK